MRNCNEGIEFVPGIEVHSVSPPRIEWTKIWDTLDMLNVEYKPNEFGACLEMVLRKQLLFFKSFLQTLTKITYYFSKISWTRHTLNLIKDQVWIVKRVHKTPINISAYNDHVDMKEKKKFDNNGRSQYPFEWVVWSLTCNPTLLFLFQI